jgi:hypothetical protein
MRKSYCQRPNIMEDRTNRTAMKEKKLLRVAQASDQFSLSSRALVSLLSME